MTIYEITAWCSVPHYTTFEVHAASIDEALETAKKQVHNEVGEVCDGLKANWDEFEIFSEGDAAPPVTHLEPSRLAENAALELRDALQHGTNIAQRVVNAWECGDLAETVRALSQWLVDARAALNKATRP